jgi:uncharacterized protein (DUF1778 family)
MIKPKVRRPTRVPGEKSDVLIMIRVTPAEAVALSNAARDNRQSRAAFIRDLAVTEAAEYLEK